MNCLRTVIVSLAVLVCASAAAEAAPTDDSKKISVCLEGAKGDPGANAPASTLSPVHA
jgi:hypothetical protein